MSDPAADADAVETWILRTQHWVDQSFGENSSKANDFTSAGPMSMRVNDAAWNARELLRDKLNVLRAYTHIMAETVAMDEASAPQAHSQRAGTASKKVFVVHGHDNGVKETVARFLQKVGLEPVILHEQANVGRTIIEKFEAHADVAFAVVLLTPDDRGGTAWDPVEKYTPRARQNVMRSSDTFSEDSDASRSARCMPGSRFRRTTAGCCSCRWTPTTHGASSWRVNSSRSSPIST
jgi:hypothetical protein